MVAGRGKFSIESSNRAGAGASEHKQIQVSLRYWDRTRLTAVIKIK
jgi:hypothetical protein